MVLHAAEGIIEADIAVIVQLRIVLFSIITIVVIILPDIVLSHTVHQDIIAQTVGIIVAESIAILQLVVSHIVAI